MAYRERSQDDRWTVPRHKVPERDLPQACRLAFEVFDKQLELRSHERPLYLESPHDEVTEVFFPDYDVVAPTLRGSAAGCGCMSFLIVSATGAAAWVARFLFDDQVMWWTLAIGGVLFLVAQVWWWATELRERRRIQALPRPPAYGVYLLADAVVRRLVDRCFYFPRRAIVEVFEDSMSFNQGCPHFTPSIRYVNAKGAEETTSLAVWQDEQEGLITQLARHWLSETEPADLDTR